MTESELKPSGPDKIYLEPCCIDPSTGRQWCEDDVWPDCGSHEQGGIEYVRADLARTHPPEYARLIEAAEAARKWMEPRWQDTPNGLLNSLTAAIAAFKGNPNAQG